LHEEKISIAQKEVGEKTNEIPELKNLLSPLNIKGTNVTTDAMHTQVESATFIVREKEANYTMIVKDNQPTLKKQLEASLGNQAFSPSDILSPFRNGQSSRKNRATNDFCCARGSKGILIPICGAKLSNRQRAA